MCLTYGMAWGIMTATVLSSQCKNSQWKGVTSLVVKSVDSLCSVINALIYSEMDCDERKRQWESEILQIPLNVPGCGLPQVPTPPQGITRACVSANLCSRWSATLTSLWFDCMPSSKLQHVSFPVGVGGIWCGAPLRVPCSLWNRKLFCWEDPSPCLTWWPGRWTASVSNP